MPNTKFSRQRSKYALGRVNATTQIEITCSELTSLLFKKKYQNHKKEEEIPYMPP